MSLCFLIFFPFSARASSDLSLHYNKPAAEWTQALPIGNGSLGAMVFGGVAEERLQINEDTLWSGAPRDWNNPRAKTFLPHVRKLIFDGEYAEADFWCKQLQGPFTEAYMPMGNVWLEFPHNKTEKYRRDLDLSNAIATVKYIIDGVTYTREVFASFPGRVIVMRMSANAPGAVSFAARLDSELVYIVQGENNTLTLTGKAPKHAKPGYLNDPNPLEYDNADGEGMNFVMLLRAVADGGNVSIKDFKLVVENADSVTLILSAATSFNGYDKSPGLQGKDPLPIAAAQLDAAADQSYEQLRARHVADYQSLFNRVSLDLGAAPDGVDAMPTDKRVARFGGGDPGLVALMFQYGRYLLISSSRPGSQPANLQGIWNDSTTPPWSSNYTININTEMNYWPAEVANLAECHEPLFSMIKDLSETGAVTARVNYGAHGWVAHHNTDLWRQSAPVGDYGGGDPLWAMWPMGGAWLSLHLWERYAYSGDVDFLRNNAYPIMKGAAAFLLDWLVDDGTGRLVTAPSTSPENSFFGPDGKRAAVSAASTMDISFIRELFTDCIEASEILGMDEEFRGRLEQALSKLMPLQIAPDGRLQEWMYDFDEVDPRHRHISLLVGVHPGRQITQRRAPELFAAARKSLEARGDGGTGWSLGWKIIFRARFFDGDHALLLIDNVLKLANDDIARIQGRGGVYTNLFGAHPPFQIDGNFAFTAGVAEMLLQSHEGDVHLLPALPAAWPDGGVRGLRARGGFTVDIAWANGNLASARILSVIGNRCRVQWKDQIIEFDTVPGSVYDLRVKDGKIEIQ